MATLIRAAQIDDRRRRLSDGALHDTVVPAPVEPPPHAEAVPRDDPRVAALELELETLRTHAARTEAELQTLLRGIDEARADAVEQGRRAGHDAGVEAGRAALAHEAERLTALCERLSSGYAEVLADHEDALVEVVFAAVTRMLGDTLVSADGVAGMVRQAIGGLVQRDRLVVHLAPDDKQMLDALASAGGVAAFEPAVEIVADERVAPGGCLLQTRSGGIDARLDVQLRQLREALASAAARRRAQQAGPSC